MKKSKYFLSLLLIIFFIQCDDSDDEAPRRYFKTMQVDGRERSYLVSIPSQYKTGSPVPLVVALHGTGGEATQFERDYGWNEKSESENFIIVYPDGVRSEGRLKLRSWNAGRCCLYAAENHVDDVKFISNVIDDLVSGYDIDENKIFVTGMSNGGMMSYRLACEISGKIAAIASVSGNLITDQPCEPAEKIPVLHIHSSIDEKVPYQGGTGLGGYYFPPTDSGLQIFADRYGCINPPDVEENAYYRHMQWNGCEENGALESYLVFDGGHSWPGGLKPRPASDDPSTAINATDVIWEFFERHAR